MLGQWLQLISILDDADEYLDENNFDASIDEINEANDILITIAEALNLDLVDIEIDISDDAADEEYAEIVTGEVRELFNIVTDALEDSGEDDENQIVEIFASIGEESTAVTTETNDCDIDSFIVDVVEQDDIIDSVQDETGLTHEYIAEIIDFDGAS